MITVDQSCADLASVRPAQQGSARPAGDTAFHRPVAGLRADSLCTIVLTCAGPSARPVGALWRT